MESMKIGHLFTNNSWHQLTVTQVCQICHLPLSNTNYQIALNSLTDGYDNPRLIVKTHIRAIFQLKPLQKESASELRKLIVAFEENLMAIQALKVVTVPCGFFWVDLLSEKLEAESRRQFELDAPEKDLQTLDQLRQLINRRVQVIRSFRIKDSSKQFRQFHVLSGAHEVPRFQSCVPKLRNIHRKMSCFFS